MSASYSSSDSCKRELGHARNQQRMIIPIRFYDYVDGDLSHDIYAPFVEDFDQGFRQLTQLILQEPRSSWEYMGQQTDEALCDSLGKGLLPGLIAKEVGEWAIVQYLWTALEDFLLESKAMTGSTILHGFPRTAIGVVRQCNYIVQQFGMDRSFLGITLVQETAQITAEFIEEISSIKDDDHLKAGVAATTVVNAVRKQLQKQYLMRRKFIMVKEQQDNFDFDVSEKLRELVALHSRRSRYLY